MTTATETQDPTDDDWAEHQRIEDETTGAERHYARTDPASFCPVTLDLGHGVTVTERPPDAFLRKAALARTGRRPYRSVTVVLRRWTPRPRGAGRPAARRTACASSRAPDDPGEPGSTRPSRSCGEGRS